MNDAPAEIVEADRSHLPQMVAIRLQTEWDHHRRQPDLFEPPDERETEREIIPFLPRRHFFTERRHFALGWVRDGVLRGYLLYSAHDAVPEVLALDVARFFLVTDIGVERGFHGRGIGRAMLDAMHARILAQGGGMIIANIWDGNTASEKLFRGGGFTPMHTTYRLTIWPEGYGPDGTQGQD